MIATAIALTGSAILLWAGLEKARDIGSTTEMLRQLGVPALLVRAAAGLLVLAELAVAVGLALRPDSSWVVLGVIVLAGVFAGAGLVALRRRELIRCSCFGSSRRGYLGTTQIKVLPLWLGGAAFLAVSAVEHPSPSEGANRLVAVALTIAVVRMVPVVRAWREARGDRRSARETYVWLRR